MLSSVKSFLAGLVLVLVLVGAGGCSQPRPVVQLLVSPGAVRADEAVTIRATHLEPGASVALALRSVDAAGTTWTSRASFTADPDGTVDPTVAAPTSGSYIGVWGMGLFSSMDPSAGGSAQYRWPTSGGATFQFTVLDDRDLPLAAVETTRTLRTQVPSVKTFTVKGDGFVGTYVKPAGVQAGPAVLVLGGSEGGDPAFGAMILAARGIPALSVAYFKAPGLPKELANIPLEYFDTPLRWLRRQPEVDPAQLWIFGASRGSEAAALVAVNHPDVVHGLLDLSPSSTVHCAYIPGSRQQCPKAPAWRRHGKPVPAVEVGESSPEDQLAAQIPVEKITGPILTLCGGSDLLWDSCGYSAAISDRLERHSTRYPKLELRYPDAGHAVDFPMPYQPMPPRRADSPPTDGSTPTANEQARADAWNRILDFIRTPS